MAGHPVPTWTTTIPGHTGHALAIDARGGSLFVGDGWGVANRALRVRRLDPATGAELATASTRSRAALALLRFDDVLGVSTDRRLLLLDPETCETVREVEYSGVRHGQRLGADDDRIVIANWLSAQVVVIDRATAEVVRRRLARQLSMVAAPSDLRVYSAFDGGHRRFAPDHSVVRYADGPAVTDVASDRTTWGVVASKRTDDQGLYHHPSTSIARLDEPGPTWDAPTAVSRIHVDDERSSLWLIDEKGRLLRMDQHSGRVVEANVPGQVRLVDAHAGLAIAGVPLETVAWQLSAYRLDGFN